MDSITRLREVVDFLKKVKDLTNEEVSTSLGYRTKSYVSDILGGAKPISSLFLERLQHKYDINPGFITGQEENMIIDVDKSGDNSILYEPKVSYLESRRQEKNRTKPFLVPLIPVDAQAGYSKYYNDTDFLNQMEYYPIVPGIDPHGAIWRFFQVKGDSMQKFLNEGDYVLASQVPKEDWMTDLKDFMVYVIVTENLVTVKYVAKRKGGRELVLIPKNEKFSQMAINIESVKEIWKYRRHIGWDASAGKKLEIKI